MEQRHGRPGMEIRRWSSSDSGLMSRDPSLKINTKVWTKTDLLEQVTDLKEFSRFNSINQFIYLLFICARKYLWTNLYFKSHPKSNLTDINSSLSIFVKATTRLEINMSKAWEQI